MKLKSDQIIAEIQNGAKLFVESKQTGCTWFLVLPSGEYIQENEFRKDAQFDAIRKMNFKVSKISESIKFYFSPISNFQNETNKI